MGELNYPRSEVARREIAKKNESEKIPTWSPGTCSRHATGFKNAHG